MRKLHPWLADEPERKYVPAIETDLRKTFKAVRAKLVRLAEKKARKERKK